MNRSVTAPAAVDYPSSDGQPMAESEFQLIPLIDAIAALRSHYAHREDMYVVGNMFLYYEEGNPRAVVAPDVFAVVGAPKHKRHSYKLWEEPKAPDFVLEVTSRSTRVQDLGRKRELYVSLGVIEYWMFDPTGDYLVPRLQGFRLHESKYRPLPSVTMEDGGLSLPSEVLGLDVRLEAGEKLRFHDPVTGQDLLSYEEAQVRMREERTAHQAGQARIREERAAHQATKARLEREVEARRDVEARIAELEARLGQSP